MPAGADRHHHDANAAAVARLRRRRAAGADAPDPVDREVIGTVFVSSDLRRTSHPRDRPARPARSIAGELRSRQDPGGHDAAGNSGGHSERSIAIGTIEVAVWDAVAKIAGQPLHRILVERYNDSRIATKVFCYVGGGGMRPARR